MARRHLPDILRREKGNKVHAVTVLGVSRRLLYRLVGKHRLEEQAN